MIIKMNPEATALAQILQKTVSSDKNELEAAQNFIDQAAQTNIVEFMRTLSDILHHAGNNAVVRTAAGLQLKNNLTSKDPAVKFRFQQRWLAFPDEIRAYIKNNILTALGTENSRPSSAAQCVAYVAVVELPQGKWPELIQILVNNVLDPNSTEMVREATLETIGYICQDIDHEILTSQSNHILTAIVHGMRNTEASNHVRLAATTALLNSLEFTRANFDKESERNYIMEVVCEATQSPDTQVRVAALQCLVKIMSLYYQYMEPYMGQALFPITLEAMKSETDEVALQGIEFWSNVSDEEVDLAIEENDALEAGRPPQRTSRFYAKGALQFLIPVLLTKLTKQEEIDDEDDWNPCKSAGVCLMLLATCCGDDVVPHVLPFVKDNIKNNSWRYREAAILAFGSILGGLSAESLKPLVEMVMPVLIERMYDNSIPVRDTTAWTIGRICDIIPDVAISEDYLKPLLKALVSGLEAEARVAANVCWAFTGLAEASYEAATANLPEGETPDTYCLSQFFNFIVEQLLATTDRSDGSQSNLRSAAYEALMEMIKSSPKDCYATVQRTMIIFLERLNTVLQMSIQNKQNKAQYNDLESLLCASLQATLRKMTAEDVPQISDSVMTTLLQIFSTSTHESGGVQQDALMAVSTLVEMLGEGFLKYMDAFKPYLCLGLKNHAEHEVCGAAVGLVSDICRALKIKILPYCDEMMTLLLENLSDTTVDRSIKPQILAVFGDIAIGIGPHFRKYLDVVLQTLIHATQVEVDRNNYDMLEYLNELRENVLETYTGIIQGLKGESTGPYEENADLVALEAHVPYIASFITMVAQDQERSDSNTSAAAGLIGDLCSTFGPKVLPLLDVEPINEMLAQGRKSQRKTKTMAAWATKQLKTLKTQVNSS
ncbi:unnamed protein product [Bemisia tabaci]|uniref:Importin N-terminal domain-containing protein n=2 Tax=Bemisia tabaci TaxID=7038 RepID=A0A9P0AEI7_BEMTA|nr:PREDICTED: importin subunit beta-1 isoform X2 [Bemisia tabaci]CAH0389883.1 unnamed protein product [Bemisia tabaci]